MPCSAAIGIDEDNHPDNGPSQPIDNVNTLSALGVRPLYTTQDCSRSVWKSDKAAQIGSLLPMPNRMRGMQCLIGIYHH
jgi:hypothetical protein